MRTGVLTMVMAGGMMTALAGPAAAQESGDVGVTMGYPGAIGVVWHVTEALALRPDISLARTTSESETVPNLGGASTSSSDGWGTTVGLSALVTVAEINPVQAGSRTNFPRLRFYLAPRVAYSYTSTDSDTGFAGTPSSFESKTKGFNVSGSFGTQYSVHDRFALFGELGVQYSKSTATSDFLDAQTETDSTSFGLRSAVGVTLYF